MQFGLLNVLGLLIVAIIMIPNIIYAMKFRNVENKCTGKVLNVVEQVGRYASILLMFVPLGVWEFGFPSVFAMLVYVVGNGVLVLAYLIVWVFYFKKQTLPKAMTLAILPTCIFLLSGITLQHWFLVAAAVIFGIGHITITYQNNR